MARQAQDSLRATAQPRRTNGNETPVPLTARVARLEALIASLQQQAALQLEIQAHLDRAVKAVSLKPRP
jgi:hypothetical protein